MPDAFDRMECIIHDMLWLALEARSSTWSRIGRSERHGCMPPSEAGSTPLRAWLLPGAGVLEPRLSGVSSEALEV